MGRPAGRRNTDSGREWTGGRQADPAISWTGLKEPGGVRGPTVGTGPWVGELRSTPRHVNWAGLVLVGKVWMHTGWLKGHRLQNPHGAEGHNARMDWL